MPVSHGQVLRIVVLLGVHCLPPPGLTTMYCMAVVALGKVSLIMVYSVLFTDPSRDSIRAFIRLLFDRLFCIR